MNILELLKAAFHNPILEIVVVCIVMDTIFGILRAIKEKKFNSNFGINGAIRKIGMLISLLALVIVDSIICLNLIGFIPEEVRTYLPSDKIGTMEFFAILYVAYEIVSILKNMALSGLPVRGLWITIKKALSKYTSELPDDEDGTDEAEAITQTDQKEG